MSSVSCKSYRANLRGKFCECGNPAVKSIGDGFTCQACLDKDPIVEEIHRQAAADRMRAETPYNEESAEHKREISRAWHWQQRWGNAA